ncbi:hypothetical protein [Haladaptatus salinisoli]|uniref:hypothetical protein n=1 Tax=Haladaptatus salinisoli TaxID=2884876 RepID=UPI001D099F80|nr:hypothetical protein [Haladaptatus salinisoli]
MVGNSNPNEEESIGASSDTRDELRTIGFRLREIQRLLGMRVKQENRRLETEGIDPVSSTGFFKDIDRLGEISQTTINEAVDSLGDLGLGDSVRGTLSDGTTIEGTASPIDYTPAEHLRLEVESVDDPSIRYELISHYKSGKWEPIRVRRYQTGDDDWIPRGVITNIRTPP